MKQKSLSLSRNLILGTFGKSFVPNKGKSALPPLFNSPEVLPPVSDEVNLFAKNFF